MRRRYQRVEGHPKRQSPVIDIRPWTRQGRTTIEHSMPTRDIVLAQIISSLPDVFDRAIARAHANNPNVYHDMALQAFQS